ncbi:MAG: hypothetical protein OES26_06715 [Gammaproteobacteria bacterium]|nr:hypothetical protein [Gammaproteobacteria bacterium]
MSKFHWLIACSLPACLVFTAATAAELAGYPTKGQSAEQQSNDEYQCYGWVKSKTEFDPAQAAAPVAATSAEPKEKRRKRILGGALAGAVIGEVVDDDAGKGAAIGAVGAGVFGAAKRREGEVQQQQA